MTSRLPLLHSLLLSSVTVSSHCSSTYQLLQTDWALSTRALLSLPPQHSTGNAGTCLVPGCCFLRGLGTSSLVRGGGERMKIGQTHMQQCCDSMRVSASQLAHVDNDFDNLSWTIVLRILDRSCSCQNTHSPGSTLTQGFPHLNVYVDVGKPNSGSNFAWTVCVT